MDEIKEEEKKEITRDDLITFINRLCNKRAILFQLNNDDNDFTLIKI